LVLAKYFLFFLLFCVVYLDYSYKLRIFAMKK